MIWLIALVQIITESFPISSSGHVALFTAWLHKFGYTTATDCMIDELTALPTLLVIGICYMPRVIPMIVFSSWYQIITFWWCIGIATIPTVLVYFYIHYAGSKLHLPLWIGFALSALLLFSTRYASTHVAAITIPTLFLIGSAQAIVLPFPGLSRMATTYAVSCWLGIASTEAFALSIAFECPLLIGAMLKAIVFHPASWRLYMRINWLSTVLLAMAAAMIGLRYMMMLADYHMLWYVSYYLLLPLMLSMLVQVV